MSDLLLLLRIAVWASSALLCLGTTAALAGATEPATSQHNQAERMAAEIVSRMTIDEKIAQLLDVAPSIPRLNIPAYNWLNESLHGAIGPAFRAAIVEGHAGSIDHVRRCCAETIICRSFSKRRPAGSWRHGATTI